jgi:hypothetical protein
MNDNQQVDDRLLRRALWREGLMEAIRQREIAPADLCRMVEAGLNEASSEALSDAAEICDKVGAGIDDPKQRRMAEVLANAMRNYDALNRRTCDGA